VLHRCFSGGRLLGASAVYPEFEEMPS